jgi:hypothetical protein
MFIFAYIARFRAILLSRNIEFPVADDKQVSCVITLLLFTQRCARFSLGCSFEDSAFWIRQFTSILAINCIITWTKMLKFCKNIPAMTHIIAVITHSLPLMMNFMLVFLIIFSGFAFGHLLAYGDTIGRFKDATSSFYSMYRVLAGDFDFTELYRNNRIIGPAFLLMWTMIGLTVLFNVFVAILMESYEVTKTEEVGFVDMIQENLQPFMQTMDRMLKKFSKEADNVDDVPQGEIDPGLQEQARDALSPASSGRLKRVRKKAIEAEVGGSIGCTCDYSAVCTFDLTFRAGS